MAAQWIGNEFERTSVVLLARRMEGSHTGVAICQALESMLGNWKVSKARVHLVVADNASNIKRAMKEGRFEAPHTL